MMMLSAPHSFCKTMIIDFSKIEEQLLPHFREGDGAFVMRAFADEKVKVMQGVLVPGASIGMHTHVQNSEIIFMCQGEGTMTMADGNVETLLPGYVHYCKMGEGHSLKNNGKETVVFLAVIPEHH